MNLETFKDHYMLRPEQVIIIDRAFVLDEDEMHLLALTYKENAYTLWVMASLSEEIEESEMIIDPLKHTNRESIKGRMPDTRAIESLEIGEHVFEFNGSTTNSFYFQGNQSLHKLQYFIEQGIELSYWNDVPLNKMQLIEYTYSKKKNRLIFLDLTL